MNDLYILARLMTCEEKDEYVTHLIGGFVRKIFPALMSI